MELMAVMLIIGILFGIIFTEPVTCSVLRKKKAKAEIEAISLALEQFGLRTRTIH